MTTQTITNHSTVTQPPVAQPAAQAPTLVPNNSLVTATPEEGRALAVHMARLIIKLTQPDAQKREELRAIYADDPMMLIAIGQTVATEFATIAAANNYWTAKPSSG
jgi:hypothetical protein